MLKSKNPFCPFTSKTVFYARPKCLFVLVLWVMCLGVSIFYRPVRNLVYPSYIRPAWRDLETNEIFKMRFLSKEEPEGFVLTCSHALSAPAEDPLAGAKNSTCQRGIINNVSSEQTREMLARGLGRYLPTLSSDQKMAVLRLYAVMAKALEGQRIPFFLTAGSLLGAMRHGGFVPWDDDLDIGIDVTNMYSARNALGCIPGLAFVKFSHFHWKLHYQGREFPFIDVFFFENDGRYLRALTYYITTTFVYLYEDVYPLTRMEFEGCISVPVPSKGLNVLKRIYNYPECTAYEPHMGVNKMLSAEFPNGYERTNVPCELLLEFYKINQLEG